MTTDIEEAERTVARALELDPNLAEIHATLGFIRMFHYWDWAGAQQSLDRALELDANSTRARHWRGVLLSFHGRFDEAKAEMRRALELDPLNLNFTSDLGQLHYFAREYAQAETYCKNALAIDPNYGWAHLYLTEIYRIQAKDEQAYQHYVAAVLDGTSPNLRPERAGWYEGHYRRGGLMKVHQAEIDQEFELLKRKPEQMSSHYYSVALTSLRLGQKDKAIANLTRSLETKQRYEIMNFGFPYLKVDPKWDNLREDPRFEALTKKINL